MRFWACRLVCCFCWVGLYNIDFVCVVANSGDLVWQLFYGSFGGCMVVGLFLGVAALRYFGLWWLCGLVRLRLQEIPVVWCCWVGGFAMLVVVGLCFLVFELRGCCGWYCLLLLVRCRFCWGLRGIAVLLRVWYFTGTGFCMLRFGLLGWSGFRTGLLVVGLIADSSVWLPLFGWCVNCGFGYGASLDVGCVELLLVFGVLLFGMCLMFLAVGYGLLIVLIFSVL